jgi:hypothetical protein
MGIDDKLAPQGSNPLHNLSKTLQYQQRKTNWNEDFDWPTK